MCCRVQVEPLDPETAIAILTTAQFVKQEGGSWIRTVLDEEVEVRAHLINDHHLEISLYPSITHLDHHAHKRQAAGIMFETAWRYAEKVMGTVSQTGINVPECMEGGRQHFLGSSPTDPMTFERLCVGFKEVFLSADHV